MPGKLTSTMQLNTSPEKDGRIYSAEGISQTLTSSAGGVAGKTGLYEVDEPSVVAMGFPDSFFYKSKFQIDLVSQEIVDTYKKVKDKKITAKFVSDSQLYKQAGNTITKHVIKAIIKKLLPLLID
jgi:site-specific DNA-cytosine methylase